MNYATGITEIKKNSFTSVSTDEEIQQWLDEQTTELAKQEAKTKALMKKNKLPSFEHMKFEFRREIYRKAIGG